MSKLGLSGLVRIPKNESVCQRDLAVNNRPPSIYTSYSEVRNNKRRNEHVYSGMLRQALENYRRLHNQNARSCLRARAEFKKYHAGNL